MIEAYASHAGILGIVYDFITEPASRNIMDHFEYRNGILHCEELPISQIAERFGTPAYIYSQQTIEDHYDRIARAFDSLKPLICYSIKSCQNLSILRLLQQRGSAFDVVSGGELSRALEAGADPGKIVFAGVGKTDPEIRQALEAGIGWFNIESEAELENIQRIASELRTPANAALRVNPDVDPKTHRYTTTGKRETKFGVDLERARNVFAQFGNHDWVKLNSIHVHLGSPVNTIDPYQQAIEKILSLVDELKVQGHEIKSLNLGGGFGAHYEGNEAPPATAYAEVIVPMLKDTGLQVLLEPGRSIMANAGILLTRTIYVKQSGEKKFVIVDGAISELIRPALYDAYHFAWPAEPGPAGSPQSRSADQKPTGGQLVDVVGGICESGDFLAKDRWLPPVSRGDLVAIFSAGAYGFVMSNQYNSRPRAPEVLVHGNEMRLIRGRETYDDLVARERDL
jgi:diaminopimelate decarboxylase